ncbi:unnamed protein product, partial [Trichobilharzia regenti]
HALDALHKQLNRINDDIAIKEESLKIETDCLDLREKRMDRRQPVKDLDPKRVESYKSDEKIRDIIDNRENNNINNSNIKNNNNYSNLDFCFSISSFNKL